LTPARRHGLPARRRPALAGARPFPRLRGRGSGRRRDLAAHR